jgi:hypothetical protein
MSEVPFTRGEPVKLTERYAETLCRMPKVRVDWKSRRGIVHRCSDSEVYIRWDGLKSLEAVPFKAVERI